MSLPASNNYMWGIAQERGPILQIWVRTKSYTQMWRKIPPCCSFSRECNVRYYEEIRCWR